MIEDDTNGDAAIYVGSVVHKRLRPKPHALSYRVFSVLVDVDRIEAVSSRVRLFSYNRWNIWSLFDKDFGAGGQTSISSYARHGFAAAGFDVEGAKVLLLCYPRVLGYAFNPLSVFFLVGCDDELIALNYEVSNTFGERKSYIIAAGDAAPGGIYAQACRKELFVSPFAARTGRYSFRVRRPGAEVAVGVAFKDGAGPLIKTHFAGQASPFVDQSIANLMIRLPLMTFKVMAGIHYEALKLWWKGVPLVRGHRSPRYSASHVDHQAARMASQANDQRVG